MSELITVDSVRYQKVDRKAEMGELIAIVERDKDEDAYENGAVAEVTSVESDGDIYAKFADGAVYFVLRAEYEVLVESFPEVSRPIEDEISALKVKLAELEARVEAEKKQAEPERLKVGDYAKVVSDVDNGCSVKGDIVIIRNDDGTYVPFDSNHLDGRYAGWHEESDLVLATPEEVAEAKAKLEESKKITLEVTKSELDDLVKAMGGARFGYDLYKRLSEISVRE